MEKKKTKGYLFAYTHALPTAILLLENGYAFNHGGSDAGDAKSWLQHYLPLKLDDSELELTVDDIEIIELDQKKAEEHLYRGLDSVIAFGKEIGEGIKNAIKENNKLRQKELEKEQK